MSKQEFFPKKSETTPAIYAYELPKDISRKGQLKVISSNKGAQQHIKEQIDTTMSTLKIEVEQLAMHNDGSSFRDHKGHEYLRNYGIKKPNGEWFAYTKSKVGSAIKVVRGGKSYKLLVSLGVFNSALMNDAVYKFKLYEDASLEYTGFNRHQGRAIWGYETVITRNEFDQVLVN